MVHPMSHQTAHTAVELRERVARMRIGLVRDPSIIGQAKRFVLAGGLVAVVNLLTTTVLALVVGLPFQLALSGGLCLSLLLHFTLQRIIVWRTRDGYALSLRRQAGRYLLVAGIVYAATSATTRWLSPVVGLPKEIVYVATVAIFTVTNFVLFRRRIFHSRT
jgi:putative flippase GtrA